MRIACLQFAPQVGDVEDNLNCADAVLAGANPDDLDSLDLLILPELAFTGYNFKSLQHISSFLEEAGSGISSLWARTTALKHDCTVVVGYPERVDVSAKWPASPEYYNSALIVNGDGDSAGNYRKSFLYYTDETWALEGGDGFFKANMSGLGNVALGICTDLNPYKLEAPWDAFEFGFHVLEAQANVVILTMAWQTHQDPILFTRTPEEPDVETLVYWVQRLEPLIRRDKEEETIVVFCNRTGAEDEATYTGTSAVIGIKRGEVFVYGVLGRGVNDLLVVDTDCPPGSKLTDADAVGAGYYSEQKHALDMEMDRGQTGRVWDDVFLDASPARQCQLAGSGAEVATGSPRTATSPRLPWLAQADHPGEASPDTRSPTRLQIPVRPQFDEYASINSAIADDVIIDTPAVPDSAGFVGRPRPKQAIPASPWRFPNKASPYPWHHHDGSHSSVFGAGATMTPITPFDEDGWSSTPIDPKAPQWFWKHEPTLSALAESVGEEDEPAAAAQAQSTRGGEQGAAPVESQEASDIDEHGDKQPDRETDASEEATEAAPLDSDWADLADVLEGLRLRPGSAFDPRSSRTDRPSSPKSRNHLSRSTSRSRLFPRMEPAYEEEPDSAAPYARYSDLYRAASGNGWRGHADNPNTSSSSSSSSSGGPARPASRAGHSHRLLQRSDSPDGTSWNHRKGSMVGARPPSRLRHAIFVADDSERESDDEYESDRHESFDGSRPRRSVSRGRQPGPRGFLPTGSLELNSTPTINATSDKAVIERGRYQPEEEGNASLGGAQINPMGHGRGVGKDMDENADSGSMLQVGGVGGAGHRKLAERRPSPLCMEAVSTMAHHTTITTAATAMTTPSLCSATSVSTFGDSADQELRIVTPRMEDGFGTEEEPVILRDYGIGGHGAVPLLGTGGKNAKGDDVWVGSRGGEAGYNV